MLITPTPSCCPYSSTRSVLGTRPLLVSALQQSTGLGDMRAVPMPKAPSGVSGAQRRVPVPCHVPVPEQYLQCGPTTAATTSASAGKAPPGCRALWEGRWGG